MPAPYVGGANLAGANLDWVDPQGADLKGLAYRGPRITQEQIARAELAGR